MPKGKKGKGGKGKAAKLTEEEKILKMEQKMLQEEEMRQKKEEMLAQFLKDKLAKEEKNSKFNLSKLQNQWRVIMRESKFNLQKCSLLFLLDSTSCYIFETNLKVFLDLGFTMTGPT